MFLSPASPLGTGGLDVSSSSCPPRPLGVYPSPCPLPGGPTSGGLTPFADEQSCTFGLQEWSNMGDRFRNRRCFLPKTAPEAPKTPPRGPKTAQKAPKMLPRCLPAVTATELADPQDKGSYPDGTQQLGMILYLADLMLNICIL